MKEQWIVLSTEDPTSDARQLRDLLTEGWEEHPGRKTIGTDRTRVIPLIWFESEEEQEEYMLNLKQPYTAEKLLDMDANLLSVPIISYDEEKEGAENQYKILAQRGYKQVHKTSKEAIMQLSVPGLHLEPYLIHLEDQGLSVYEVVSIIQNIWGVELDMQEIRPWLEKVGYKVPEPDAIGPEPEPQPESPE